VLRATAAPVPGELFNTPELRALVKDMEDTLAGERDGVALAAPQIGVSKRMFVVRYDRMQPPPPEGEPPRLPEYGVYINPVFVNSSRKREEMDEGCLSVRGMYGTTLRHERVTVRAQDETGAWFERGAGGILAQAFQHEIDHLDGMLFIDHAFEVHEHHKVEHHA
jgi:peptide deformylase